jgi:hypothetical protein
MTQKQRSLTTLAVVLGLAAAIGAYAWFGVYQVGKQEEAAKERTDTLFEFKKDDVLRLSVTAQGDATEAERSASSGGGDAGATTAREWRIVAPIHAPGDAATLDGVVDKLSGLKQKREVKAPGDLASYGLDKPRIKVIATLSDGKTAELDIGVDNPYDGTIFAKKAGDERVSILEPSVRPPLDKSTFDLRDKRLFSFEESALERLDVASGKNVYALERTGDGQWKLTAPLQLPADTAKANQVASAVRGLRATRFATEQSGGQDLGRYGLAKPIVTVEMVLANDPQQKTLVLGEVVEGETHRVFAKRPELPYVAEVPATILKELDQSVGDLRDKTVLSFDAGEVAGLRFAFGSSPAFEVTRIAGADGGSDTWRLGAPSPGPAKKWRLASLVTWLHDLKGSSIAADQASDSQLEKDGLKPPKKTVSVLGSGDRVIAQLLVGNDEGGKTFVKSAEKPAVFQIETSRLGQLPADAPDLAEPPPPGDGGSVTAATSTPAKK